METRFLREALFSGMTGNAFKLGTVLTLGWFWTRIAGCHNIYRGQDGNIDYDNIQATMSLGDEQVVINGQALPANTIWYYIRRQASHCGLESPDSPACRIIIDGSGEMIGNAPNSPVNLSIEGISGGRFRLRWRYTKIGQETAPTGFKIFIDSGEGFNWESPMAIISFLQTKSGEFSWISGELTHGSLYRFAVRSYRTGMGESQNTNFVAAIADSVGPDAITNIQASWVQV